MKRKKFSKERITKVIDGKKYIAYVFCVEMTKLEINR